MSKSEQSTPVYSFVMSAAGVVLAIIIFVAVWFVGGIVFNLFDNVRGLGDDVLHTRSGDSI